MAWEAKKQFRGKPLQCDIGLDIDFYVSNHRSDLDNLLKATLDCLTGIVWKDDKQIIELLVRKYVDKKNPRIEMNVNNFLE
jgi:Holliday junction resolvase RusA-like endonuclease